jgi:uncharacterized protein YeaO (DUF488 family)
MGVPSVGLRRVHDPPSPTDGVRILVDRIWPRGLSKEKARLDEWCKQVAPSAELRKWYAHDPTRYEEFRTRYLTELEEPERASALAHLRKVAAGSHVTLLTATHDIRISQAAVLAELVGS